MKRAMLAVLLLALTVSLLPAKESVVSGNPGGRIIAAVYPVGGTVSAWFWPQGIAVGHTCYLTLNACSLNCWGPPCILSELPVMHVEKEVVVSGTGGGGRIIK